MGFNPLNDVKRGGWGRGKEGEGGGGGGAKYLEKTPDDKNLINSLGFNPLNDVKRGGGQVESTLTKPQMTGFRQTILVLTP